MGSLGAAFARVPDPRRSTSVAYPLAAVLSLAVAAILAKHCSELAIAQWGTGQPTERLRTLGFLDGRTPCQSTLQRLFRKLDGALVRLAARFVPPQVRDRDDRGGEMRTQSYRERRSVELRISPGY